MYLEVNVPILSAVNGADTPTLTYGFGNALVKQAEIEIGGQLIDRQYGDWMNIWTELTVPEGKREGYDNMVGNKLPTGSIQTGSVLATAIQRFYVPLQFWFNRNPGLALPLIALQYHEVKLNLELRSANELLNVLAPTVTTGLGCKLYVDYIYLDTDERRRFAQVSHEYLIEQVQFTGAESIGEGEGAKNVTLNFNHPVKELIWAHVSTVSSTSGHATGNRWFNYSGTTGGDAAGASDTDSFTTALLQLNGHDRFSVRHADYFRKVQNYEHHTRCPRVGKDLDTDTERNQYIYSYSFALSPEEHQPSGTCNFSRIDNAVLQLKYGADTSSNILAQSKSMNLNVYAVNYNVLRIMSGMGGLAYSN